MFEVKIYDTTLVVGSKWDSGTHKGFYATTQEAGQYSCDPLNITLSKEQIQAVEAMIATTIIQILEEK